MKKKILYVSGLLLMAACSNEEADTTTYGVDEGEVDDEDYAWLMDNAYQVTVDESFELISKYVRGSSDNRMFFWHESSASEFDFLPEETTSDVLKEEVPTIEVFPTNKYQHVYERQHFEFGSSEEEIIDGLEEVQQEVEENSAEYLKEMKDEYIELMDEEVTVLTNEDNEIDPFTYLVQHETEAGVSYYELFGEGEDEYLRASLTMPSDENESLFETMLASVSSMTFDEDEFEENPERDEPSNLGYEPSENLKGDYPEVGYSFELPEAPTFRHSYPVYHVYRYTFTTLYDELIEKDHVDLASSSLVVRVEKQENAPNREQELRNRELDDFVAFQYDSPRSIDYLHEAEAFDTGVFTTAVSVEFGGYEEYWFLKEIDGHVYEIFFDLAVDAAEYDALLESYMKVVRSFELTGVDE